MSSKVLVTDTHLSDIAAAIRSKNGESTSYKPGEMAQAILDIPSGGSAVIESKNITANGTYTAPTGVDGYNPVTVAVQPNLQSKTATENGTVTPDSGYDGLSSVVVNVSGGGSNSPPVQIYAEVQLINGYTTISYSYKSFNIAPLAGGNNIIADVQHPFEIGIRFKADASSQYRILCGHTKSWWDAPWAQLDSSAQGDNILFFFAFPTSASDLIGLQITANDIPFSQSSIYNLKFGFDGTKIYASATDGTNSKEVEQAVSSLYSNNTNIVFGSITNLTENRCAVGVHFDLAHCYIKQNGVIVWGEGAS